MERKGVNDELKSLDNRAYWKPRLFFGSGRKPFMPTRGRRVFEPEETVHRRKHQPASNDKAVRPAIQIVSIPVGTNSTREDCVPMKKWQVHSYPTCNSLHETSMMETNIHFLGRGTIRSTWEVDLEEISVVMKTLQLMREDREFTPQMFESHRRDAMATERLTSSPHVVDVFGFCGQSCINEMLKSNLEKFHKRKPSVKEKMRVARDASVALRDVHTVDGEYATIVHRDVTHRNFLISRNGTIKLNDFNIGRFPEWDVKANAPCGFRKNDCTGYRSPEECGHGVLSEKMDIYMLGNTLYFILTAKEPYHYPKRVGGDKVRELITHGVEPPIPPAYENSSDPAIVKLLEVIHRCRAFNPLDRPSARQVADELSAAYDRLSKRNGSRF